MAVPKKKKSFSLKKLKINHLKRYLINAKQKRLRLKGTKRFL